MMIRKLKVKDNISFLMFLEECKDKFQDFYVTVNRERKFFNNVDFIKKILKYQVCYGYFNGDDLNGIAIIYKEKNFRPYLKIMSKSLHIADDLLKVLSWNYNIELYAKYKKDNPIISLLQKKGFSFVGDRGKEILLVRKPRPIKKEDKNGNDNSKS